VATVPLPGHHGAVTAATVTAETTAGTVRGAIRDEVAVFRGVPYARAPVGPGRFRPPSPPEPWAGVRDALHAGPVAPQNPSALERLLGASSPTMDEDCLSVNVWTPAADDGRRPVLVWIHGGAFLTGAGSFPWYRGTSFARRGDVVVVTCNYRLGALGFLHLADLGGEAYASSGDVGLLDQVAALTWVRDNVAAFGGGPCNVTVFGESAGAMSVGTLLGAPAARGLFGRAVAQSGAASNVHDRDAATRVAVEVLDALGLGTDEVAVLHDVDVATLLRAQEHVVSRARALRLPFQPVVDGTTVPTPPLEAVAAGAAADVDLLLGTNLDETRLFTALDPRVRALDEAVLLAQADEIFGTGAGAGALEAYRANRPGGTVLEVWNAILCDQIFRVPAVRLAERHAATGGRTWLYQFSWATPAFDGALGACHALEIPFVFNALDAPGVELFTGPRNPAMDELALRLHDAWIAFARTGDPRHPGLPVWPPFEAGGRATMVFDEICAVEADPAAAELALWPSA
jgi:para-nitrobenzyl esterase